MQYILTSKNKPGVKLVFTYHLNGFLKSVETEGIDHESQLKFIFWNDKFPFPYVQSLINPLLKLNMFNVRQLEDDLSFDRFWEVYGYKVSRKKAEKLWDKLSKAKRILVFLHLPKYESYLAKKGIEKAYPDTYLRNEKYNDEY